ncbi:MAG TPA: M12 family metallo-peptidase [Frankiaceae bacterium]|nr:M12 family metallo-peptidase [Frankiaceae bacterium]
MRSLPLLTSALAVLVATLPAAADATPVVRGRREVVIRGSVSQPDVAGCGSRASTGCDEHAFAVDAKAGAWVTVRVEQWMSGSRLLVRSADGRSVSESGDSFTRVDGHAQQPADDGSVTFRQPSSGVVRYVLGVSSPGFATEEWSYRARIRLGGAGWDREEDCSQFEPEVVPPVPADLTKPLKLGVTIVTTPDLLPQVRRESAVIVDDFRALNIGVRLRYVAVNLPEDGDRDGLLAAAKKRFGGERPAGADVVYVASDYFAGGYADCLGGVRYPERAFAIGQVNYTAQGVSVPGNGGVRMGHIAAHEIGHLLGAHHEHSNCAEAAPAADPGPCTVMSPAGLTGSGEWSALEAAFVRHHVERYARG